MKFEEESKTLCRAPYELLIDSSVLFFAQVYFECHGTRAPLLDGGFREDFHYVHWTVFSVMKAHPEPLRLDMTY